MDLSWVSLKLDRRWVLLFSLQGWGIFRSWALGLRAVETRPRGSWPVDLSVWDEIWSGGVEMVWDGWLVDGYDGVVVNVLKIGYYYYIIYFSCAKNANHSQILGSPDPLFIFFTKAHRCWPWPAHIWRCADFLLLRDADLEGLEGLMPTIKFGSEMESTLHYANSDDASLHSIVFR